MQDNSTILEEYEQPSIKHHQDDNDDETIYVRRRTTLKNLDSEFENPKPFSRTIL